MFTKSTIVLAAFTLASQLVSGASTPPGCLLAAVNDQPTPANYKAICANSTSFENDLTSLCSSNLDVAKSAYTSVCSVHSYTVAPVSSTSSKTSTAKPVSTHVLTTEVFDSSCSCTKTSMYTSVQYAAVTGSAATTTSDGGSGGTGSASATGTAGAATTGAAAVGMGMSAGALVVAGLALLL